MFEAGSAGLNFQVSRILSVIVAVFLWARGLRVRKERFRSVDRASQIKQ